MTVTRPGDLPWPLGSRLGSYFLGLCPFFGVSGRLQTAFRLGLANIFVMVITSIAAWALNTFVLAYAPYLRLISFIVVIASTVQFVEMVIRKLSPALFRALGIFLPLITTNCAILALALFQTSRGYGFLEGLVFAVGAGGGLTLALVLMAGLREEAELLGYPVDAPGDGDEPLDCGDSVDGVHGVRRVVLGGVVRVGKGRAR